MKKKQDETAHIRELTNYLKYLYEGENERTRQINSATTTYLIFITFAFSFISGLIGLVYPNSLGDMLIISSQTQLVSLVILAISFILIVISFILTIMVIKVWNFERLCEPSEFVEEVMEFDEIGELISSIAANYVIAIERNYKINNSKARYLSIGLRIFIVGFLFFMVSFFAVQIIG